MKKILAIIVIGLILNTSAYANNMIKTGKKKFDYEIRYADYNEFIVTYNLGIINTWNFYDTRFVDLAKDHCFKFGKSVVLYYVDSKAGTDIILSRKAALRAHCFSFTEMRGLVEAGNQFFLKHSFLRKIAWEKKPDFKYQIGNFLKNTPSLLAYHHRNKELKAIIIKPDGKTFTTSLRTASKDFGINNNEKNLTAKKPKTKETPKPSPDDNKIVAAASGTGFFVSPSGHIITNHHVIDGCQKIKFFFKGEEKGVKVLAIDKVNDLAIIKSDIKPTRIFSVSDEDAQLLEDIIIAGFPLGKKISSAIKTSKGSVTALAGYGDNYSEFQTDAALNKGNSGGPIINQKGNVLGVAVAAYGKKSGIESFNFGIKVSTLKTFAKANGLNFKSPNYRDLSNKDLGQLITAATVYLECHMTVAKVKQMIAAAKSRKAFFSEFE